MRWRRGTNFYELNVGLNGAALILIKVMTLFDNINIRYNCISKQHYEEVINSSVVENLYLTILLRFKKAALIRALQVQLP